MKLSLHWMILFSWLYCTNGTEVADRPSKKKSKLLNPFANLRLGLRKRRNSRTHNSSFSESIDSSHVDWEEDDTYDSINPYDSDIDIGDSETEDNSTSKSTLSSPSTEDPPDSPCKIGFMLQATLPPLGEGQFPTKDEQDSNRNISAEGPTDDNSDAVPLKGSIKNINPLVILPSSPPKDDVPVLLRRRDNNRRSLSKKETIKKLSVKFLRGVSPFRKTSLGTNSNHGNDQSGYYGASADADVGKGPSHEEDSSKEEPTVGDWQKYRAGGIFDMTEDDLRALITFPPKNRSLETLFDVGLSLDDDNGEVDRGGAHGGDETEEEKDDSVRRIYLSCLEDLARDTQTGVVGNRGNEGKIVEQSLDEMNIYSGGRDNKKKYELMRLNTLFCLYEQKKEEEIRQRRLHRRRSAHEFSKDHESHVNIPNEDNYMNMKDIAMKVNNIFDNVSLSSLPIEFIDD
ncbi:conserved Plasmodium protein, unknown function [Plasmodium knowlesi strain H]|uniref:Uncharacterized protein n=3 Tax=Plasmodium knowlesi TaxID=5850 RepID=A0A1A7VIZ8_PLAKH|nr:conserved Plasmodium protein, unknown function [Plasmodium knowlesi strain H]OTN65913.1 Uncharacterized protein PKNOH_S100067300 [Plasmodium knowlesi]CAA9988022.1 conserved Plasmodium protein, unknown function [Plasmodium knowlesi strain H]SBO22012.1 conserved Plasmodium protein, unknown function [Plasmodium knowlesi strain H]SBO29477.1 conserved Plasmodium protein, unknown function [Plasmodium knowlesi strain H]VVS77496.1 conserved Plasmodium protein, unknown function [Plasmodium knowlesi 